MVLMVISKEEEKFIDETSAEIRRLIGEILEINGISIYFLEDSKSINEGIEQITDRLSFLIENVKKDKGIIKLYKEGKELQNKIDKSEE